MARLPQIKGARLVQALKKEGWLEVHSKGSHVILANPARPEARISVPCNSKALKKGTLSAILSTAGISGDELRELM